MSHKQCLLQNVLKTSTSTLINRRLLDVFVGYAIAIYLSTYYPVGPAMPVEITNLAH